MSDEPQGPEVRPPGRSRPGTISVADPVSPAIDATKRILFSPFDARKWFVLGFSAWLSTFGEGGNYNWTNPGSGNFPGAGSGGGGADDWLRDNLSWLIPLVVVGGLLIIGLIVLVTWISSRGKFMLLDGVLNDRALVREPWNRFRRLANSLFKFRLVVGLAGFVLVLLLVAAAFAVLWPSIQTDTLSASGIPVIVGMVLVALAVAVFFGLIKLSVNDFLVPIMYLRDCEIGPAWDEFSPLLRENAGTMFVYVLFRILISIVLGVIGIVVVLCTCCIAALPYIGAVVLLPIYVFLRAYSLYFLAQFGPQYERFNNVGSPIDEVAETFE